MLGAALYVGTPPCPPDGVQYYGASFCTSSQLALRAQKGGVPFQSTLQNDLDFHCGAPWSATPKGLANTTNANQYITEFDAQRLLDPAVDNSGGSGGNEWKSKPRYGFASVKTTFCS